MAAEGTTGDSALKRNRQKRTITALAILLIVAGTIVLFFLDRMFLPLRILVGLGDIVAGWGLLILVRQKFK